MILHQPVKKTQAAAPTVIIRHQRENLKKCSLKGLEKREDLLFCKYPLKKDINLEDYILLTVDAPPLTREDQGRALCLIDGTWDHAEKMLNNIPFPGSMIRRSIPQGFKTAYPRRQDEEAGLASIEALYIAYLILGKDPTGLLDYYYWKQSFLDFNSQIFNTI